MVALPAPLGPSGDPTITRLPHRPKSRPRVGVPLVGGPAGAATGALPFRIPPTDTTDDADVTLCKGGARAVLGAVLVDRVLTTDRELTTDDPPSMSPGLGPKGSRDAVSTDRQERWAILT